MSTASDSGKFIERYYKPLHSKLGKLRKDSEEAGIPVILRETEDILSMLLKALQPENILEIGTACAYSAIFFAIRCPAAHITTIERSDQMYKSAIENVDEFGLSDRIDIINSEAEDYLADRKAENIFDFVFIDAAKTHYKEYFELTERLCRRGATIVCDNILLNGWIYDSDIPGAVRHRTSVKYMRSFLEYIKSRDDLDVCILSSGDGLAIIRLS